MPSNHVSKADLLIEFARCFNRDDLQIERVDASEAIDRTLATADPAKNAKMWSLAGQAEPPTVARMVAELSRFVATTPVSLPAHQA